MKDVLHARQNMVMFLWLSTAVESCTDTVYFKIKYDFQHNCLFIMDAVNMGGQGREEVEWEATLNQGGSRSFLDICHVG